MERAHIGYLVGYDSSNVYRVWIPHLKHVIRARDVRFDESKGYDPLEPHVPLPATVTQLVDTLDIPENVEFDVVPEQPERPEQPEQHPDEPIALPSTPAAIGKPIGLGSRGYITPEPTPVQPAAPSAAAPNTQLNPETQQLEARSPEARSPSVQIGTEFADYLDLTHYQMMVETATDQEDLTTDFRGVDTTLPIMENEYATPGAFPNDTTPETPPQPRARKFAYHPTETPPRPEHAAEPESPSQPELTPRRTSNLGFEQTTERDHEQTPEQAPEQAPLAPRSNEVSADFSTANIRTNKRQHKP